MYKSEEEKRKDRESETKIDEVLSILENAQRKNEEEKRREQIRKEEEKQIDDLIHVVPTYYFAEPQESVVTTRQVDDYEPYDEEYNKFSTIDKLKIAGGVILASIVALGMFKLGNMRNENIFEGEGYRTYTRYVDYAKENGLPISQEGFQDFIGYDYETNVVDLEGNSRGGK